MDSAVTYAAWLDGAQVMLSRVSPVVGWIVGLFGGAFLVAVVIGWVSRAVGGVSGGAVSVGFSTLHGRVPDMGRESSDYQAGGSSYERENAIRGAGGADLLEPVGPGEGNSGGDGYSAAFGTRKGGRIVRQKYGRLPD